MIFMVRYLLHEELRGIGGDARTSTEKCNLQRAFHMLQKARNEVCPVEIGGELAAIGDLAGNIDAYTVGQDQEILQCSAVSWVSIRNVGIVGIEPALFHEPAFI